jgi:uncharacterized protein YrrD
VLKVKDIIGKPVVASDSGERIETVVAPIFDRAENCLLGFLVDRDGWFSNPKVLPLYLVQAIEAHAIIIPWKESIAPASNYATIHDVLEQNNSLNNDYILTNNDLDLYFDENTGDLENSILHWG